jgi:hypothetical protein
MPNGENSKYTHKQIRQAKHIEHSYEGKGIREEGAERTAWYSQ